MRHAVIAALLVALLSGCAGPITPGRGRVSGIVGGWPARPLGGDVAPAPDKTVEFAALPHGSRSLTTSGSDGRYFIDLPAGTYEVHLIGFGPLQLLYGTRPESYGQWPRVTVVAGSETMLNLIYNSGIL